MAPNVTCALLLFLPLKEKKKKKNSLPNLIYIFPSSVFMFLEQVRGKQSCILHLVGT